MEDTPNVAGQIQVESVAPIVAPVQVKPYDDLDAYAEDIPTTNGTPEVKDPTGEPPATEGDKPAEADPGEAQETEETAPGERKGDKIEDNFDAVKVRKEINGKEVEFTVGDAIKSHMERETFNREMDRRSTSLAKERKAYESAKQADQAKLRTKVDEVFKNMRTPGGLVSGVRALANLAKADDPQFDVVAFEKMYFSNLEEVHKINQLPKEQQDAYWAKREAETHKREAENLRKEKETNEGKSALSSAVAKAQEQYGVANDEFWGAYKYLMDEATGEGKFFASKEEIQIPDVVKHVYRVRHETNVVEAGKKLGIDNEELLDQISRHTIMSETPLGVDDIVQIVKDSGILKKAPPEAVENLNRKAAKSNQQFSQGNSTKKENGTPEGYDKESLDFLYRNQPKAYTRIVRN